MFMDFKGEKQEAHSSLHLLFKQVLLRKAPEKGMAVGEHQVNKNKWRNPLNNVSQLSMAIY